MRDRPALTTPPCATSRRGPELQRGVVHGHGRHPSGQLPGHARQPAERRRRHAAGLPVGRNAHVRRQLQRHRDRAVAPAARPDRYVRAVPLASGPCRFRHPPRRPPGATQAVSPPRPPARCTPARWWPRWPAGLTRGLRAAGGWCASKTWTRHAASRARTTRILAQLAACGLTPDEPPVWQSQRTALVRTHAGPVDRCRLGLPVQLHTQGDCRRAGRTRRDTSAPRRAGLPRHLPRRPARPRRTRLAAPDRHFSAQSSRSPCQTDTVSY